MMLLSPSDGDLANRDAQRPSQSSLLVGLVGVVIVGGALIQQFATAYISGWVFAAGLVSLACWVAVSERLAWQPSRRVFIGICVAMAALAAIGSAPSNGLLVVPAAISVLRLFGDSRVPLLVGWIVAFVAAALVAVGSLTVTMSPLGLLTMEGGIALAVLGGYNRRQARAAREREADLRERTIAAREEHARATALEARQSVARDIHDVLAHSLGGLVIQLDAAAALIETGRIEDAHTRVTDARALAASGLGEARRAVDALRTPQHDDGDVDSGTLLDWLSELIAAHESMGGDVSFVEEGTADLPAIVSEPVALAMRRALQESLSNARKHASRAPVDVRLVAANGRVELTVSNPVAAGADGAGRAAVAGGTAELKASGGGNGLKGMAERFASLPGGNVTAGVRDDCFVVQAGADVR